MAVAFDAKMTGGDGDSGRCDNTTAGTSASSAGMTVGSGATLLVGGLCMAKSTGTAPTGVTMTWNGTSMTKQPEATHTGGGAFAYAVQFVLVSPAAGNLTLAAAWTNANDAYMWCASFTGTDTTTGVQVADNTTATGATAISPPTDANGATIASFAVNGADPTVDQTEIFSTAPLNPGGGASYAIGGSGTNTHNFTGGGGTVQALAAMHIIAGAAAAGQPTMRRFWGKMFRAVEIGRESGMVYLSRPSIFKPRLWLPASCREKKVIAT